MSKRLSRRTFLRGAGAVMSLPWLESISAAQNLAEPPLRGSCEGQRVRSVFGCNLFLRMSTEDGIVRFRPIEHVLVVLCKRRSDLFEVP